MNYSHLDNDSLLTALTDERHKYTESCAKKMYEMIGLLIERGVYPAETVPGNPNTVYQMVAGWGATWHQFRGRLNCPKCGTDFRCHVTGPPFTRQIGIVEHDSVGKWQCPDCKEYW